MRFEHISLEGHLLDEQTLAKVFAVLDEHGVSFQVHRFRIGEHVTDTSLIELELRGDDGDRFEAALDVCEKFGLTRDEGDARLTEADMDGVLPEEFYSTTNFTTQVRVEGEWVDVEALEMDCGIRVWREDNRWRAHTCPMHRVRAGDRLVVGFGGVKVVPSADVAGEEDSFRFMSNEISSERPKARMIADCADAIRHAHKLGQKVLLVGGPAVIHSGSAWLLEALIEQGWIDVLFAGNALATHDIEAAMMGTSLGVDLGTGRGVSHGHTHHLRAINRVRRCGSIAAAVEEGLIPSGVMRACVLKGVPFLLAGSIRDDGPLPDVITDNVAAQDAMRMHTPGVGVAIMVATTLHSVATGNMLPAAVVTYCVDNDADTVIKLTDRGTHQAVGIVTDVEFFLKELASQLGCLGAEGSGIWNPGSGPD